MALWDSGEVTAKTEQTPIRCITVLDCLDSDASDWCLSILAVTSPKSHGAIWHHKTKGRLQLKLSKNSVGVCSILAVTSPKPHGAIWHHKT